MMKLGRWCSTSQIHPQASTLSNYYSYFLHLGVYYYFSLSSADSSRVTTSTKISRPTPQTCSKRTTLSPHLYMFIMCVKGAENDNLSSRCLTYFRPVELVTIDNTISTVLELSLKIGLRLLQTMAPIPTAPGTEPWDIGASLVESRGESKYQKHQTKIQKNW
jgi:hypothetical protein